jgi:hypothetical protein
MDELNLSKVEKTLVAVIKNTKSKDIIAVLNKLKLENRPLY